MKNKVKSPFSQSYYKLRAGVKDALILQAKLERRPMVSIVEQAITEYLERQTERNPDLKARLARLVAAKLGDRIDQENAFADEAAS